MSLKQAVLCLVLTSLLLGCKSENSTELKKITGQSIIVETQEPVELINIPLSKDPVEQIDTLNKTLKKLEL